MKSVQRQSFFWSVFSRNRTEYRDWRSISPYSARIREHTDGKKLRTWILLTQCNSQHSQYANFIASLWKRSIIRASSIPTFRNNGWCTGNEIRWVESIFFRRHWRFYCRLKLSQARCYWWGMRDWFWRLMW